MAKNKKPQSLIGIAKRSFDVAGKVMSGHYIDAPESGKRTIQADEGEDAAEAQAPAPKPKKKPKEPQQQTPAQPTATVVINGESKDALAAYTYAIKDDGKAVSKDIAEALLHKKVSDDLMNLLKVFGVYSLAPNPVIPADTKKYVYRIRWMNENVEDVTSFVEPALRDGRTIDEVASILNCHPELEKQEEGSTVMEKVEDMTVFNQHFDEYLKQFPNPIMKTYIYSLKWVNLHGDDMTGIVEDSLKKGNDINQITAILGCYADITRQEEGTATVESLTVDDPDYDSYLNEYLNQFSAHAADPDDDTDADADNADAE